eukprot:988786-Rhodomonas_salina.3
MHTVAVGSGSDSDSDSDSDFKHEPDSAVVLRFVLIMIVRLLTYDLNHEGVLASASQTFASKIPRMTKHAGTSDEDAR